MHISQRLAMPVVVWLTAIWMFVGCNEVPQSNQELVHQSSQETANASATELQTGIYLVSRWTVQQDDLKPLFDNEHFVEYSEEEYQQLADDEPEPTKYIALDMTEFVPLDLDSDPQSQQGDDGRSEIALSFSDAMTRHLTDFSRRYLVRQVALVIDGDIVTLHKIRSVITGSGLKISRCTDDGCELILAKLKK